MVRGWVKGRMSRDSWRCPGTQMPFILLYHSLLLGYQLKEWFPEIGAVVFGSLLKIQNLIPSPDLLNQNLNLNDSGWFMCTLNWWIVCPYLYAQRWLITLLSYSSQWEEGREARACRFVLRAWTGGCRHHFCSYLIGQQVCHIATSISSYKVAGKYLARGSVLSCTCWGFVTKRKRRMYMEGN